MRVNTIGASSIRARDGEANDRSIRRCLGTAPLVARLPRAGSRHAHLTAMEHSAVTRKATSCLGCGTQHFDGADCEVCFARLSRCLNVFGHWPMETSLTPAALVEVQEALQQYLSNFDIGPLPQNVETELNGLVSNIRSYLQHVAAGMGAYSDEPTDEELLS